MDLGTLELDALLNGARAELADPTVESVSYLVELHGRGTREIFERSVVACASTSPGERLLGVCILRELGGPPPAFAAEAVPILLGMMEQESSPQVLRWIISALGYQHHSGHLRARLVPSPASLEAVLRCKNHGNDLVRFAVAAALPSLVDLSSPEPEAIRALIGLSCDSNAETRYYALAALTDDLGLVATTDVRHAVEARQSDDDDQIRRCARRVLDGGTWGE